MSLERAGCVIIVQPAWPAWPSWSRWPLQFHPQSIYAVLTTCRGYHHGSLNLCSFASAFLLHGPGPSRVATISQRSVGGFHYVRWNYYAVMAHIIDSAVYHCSCSVGFVLLARSESCDWLDTVPGYGPFLILQNRPHYCEIVPATFVGRLLYGITSLWHCFNYKNLRNRCYSLYNFSLSRGHLLKIWRPRDSPLRPRFQCWESINISHWRRTGILHFQNTASFLLSFGLLLVFLVIWLYLSLEIAL